jgi:hypothetical protein
MGTLEQMEGRFQERLASQYSVALDREVVKLTDKEPLD